MSFNKETGMYEGYIYCITNNVNGKQYIGQTSTTIEYRYQQHQYRSTKANYTQPLYNAFKKYGCEIFSVKEITKISKKDRKTLSDALNTKEKYYIKKYNCKVPNGYNILNGGEENPTYLTVKNVFQFDVSGNLINHYDSLRQCAKALGLKGTGWLTKCINEKREYKNHFWSHNKIIDVSQYKRRIYKNKNLLKKNKQPRMVYQFNMNGILLNTYLINDILKKYTESQIKKTCYSESHYRDGYIWLFHDNITNEIINNANEYEYKIKNNIIRTYKRTPKSNYTKKVYQFSLSGELIKEWANEAEASLFFTHNRKTSLWSVLNGYCNQAHGYMWSYSNLSPDKYKNRREKFGKKVIQYDLNFNYICTYSSIVEAAESVGSKSYTSLASVCYGKTHHSFGYIWRYEGVFDDDPFLYYRNMGYMEEVDQYDINGKYIKSYSNMIDIPNIKPHRILACCEGKEKNTGGFIWRYKNL